MKAHIYPLGKHRNNCLKVNLNNVDKRTNIAVMNILVKLLIQDYLHISCQIKIEQLLNYDERNIVQNC